MSLEFRIESLKGRHASLETRILAEDGRPRPDDEALHRLKLEKLQAQGRDGAAAARRLISG